MQLRRKIRTVREWDHVSHYLTLALIAAAELASLIEDHLANLSRLSGPTVRILADLAITKTGLESCLHVLHVLAIGIVIANVSLYLFFARNTGKEIAAGLKKRLPTESNVKSGDVSSLTHSPPKKNPAVSSDDLALLSGSADPNAEKLFTLNRQCFEGSAFEMSEHEVRARDSSFLDHNPLSFILIRNPLREDEDQKDDFIGFTCVLPLNLTGADLYLAGLIRDRDVRASMLCSPEQKSEALLLFAIALRRDFQRTKGLAAQFYPYLMRVAEHHVKLLTEVHAVHGRSFVWVQAEHPELIHQLEARGFRPDPGKKSADGYHFIVRSADL